jgi:RNA polymerase primary sigma factor
MASKTRLTPPKEEDVPEKEDSATPPDHPSFDLKDAGIERLVRHGRKCGYVTHDQISALSEEINSEQIENVLAMFSKMGINRRPVSPENLNHY